MSGALDPARSTPVPGTLSKLERAEWLYSSRRRRNRHFPGSEAIFAEPAFDLLLSLFIHGERGRPVSVSSAALAAAVRPTSALRWIATLIDMGLVERGGDPDGPHGSNVRLSAAGRAAVVSYLDDW